MSDPVITPVVLCGGSGTRLWPRSRKTLPKPFLELVGEATLFEATLERCRTGRFGQPLIVAGAVHVDPILAQAGADARIVVEPAARNTAPAIALAAALLPAETVMLVCPSDHHIADAAAFDDAAGTAARLAAEGWMVALGIAATRPETGYGYIQLGEPIDGGFRIACFVEKPDRTTAERFVADGGYAWNGGIFALQAGAFLKELSVHRPEMADQVRRAVTEGHQVGAQFHPAAEPFMAIEGESVDYAVMENTRRAAVVPADMGWCDIGSWDALRDVLPANPEGNRIRGQADLIDCRNVFVDTDGPRVSVVGLDDLIVVVDGDEILVTSGKGAQSVGKLPGAAGR
jgi:mannose-1-phosphate guanylyltransferase/mannose-6-phosphate isomerase